MAQTQSLDLELASTQYASVADNASLSVTGSCSFEAWVKLESSPATDTEYGIATKYNSTGNQRSYAFTYLNEGGTFKPRLLVSTDGTAVVDLKVTKTLSTGVWLHIAVTYNAATGTATFYLNGQSLGTAAGGPASIFDSTASFAIGVNGNGGFPAAGSYFDGLIKDVRVFNDVRTQTEIVADARTETVTDANLKGEWNFNNVYTDSSGNGSTLTASGSPVFSVDTPWEAPPGIESTNYVLDLEAGSIQYASITDASQTGLDLAGDLTFEWWQNIESALSASEYRVVISKDAGQPNRSYELSLREVSGDTVDLLTSSDGTNANTVNIRVSTSFTVGVWEHFAVSYVASTGTMTLYKNGISQGTATGGQTSIFNSSTEFRVGRSSAGTGTYFDGLLRSVRVFNSVRTQTEIVTDARTVTVVSANLKAEWSFNNVYTDASGNSNTLTASGSPVFRKWANKVAGGIAAYYSLDESSGNAADATGGGNTLVNTGSVTYGAGKKANCAIGTGTTGGYLKVSNAFEFTNASANTWNFWYNRDVTMDGYIFDLISEVASSKRLIVYESAGTLRLFANGNEVATSALTVGTWYMITVVKNNTSWEIFVDGISQGTTTTGGLTYGGGAGFVLLNSLYTGGSSTESSVDEVLISKRAFDWGNILDLYNASAAIAYVGSTAYSSTLSESVTATDDLLSTPQRTLSESQTPTDDTLAASQRNLTESQIATDTFASAFIILETLSEAVSAVDTMIRSGIRVLVESVTTTAVFLQQSVRTLLDSITASDSLITTLTRTLSEAVSATDSVIRSGVRALTESITATAAFIQESVRSLLESITASDTFARVITYGRILTESVSATDIIRKVLNGSATIWDNLTKVASSWTNRDKV